MDGYRVKPGHDDCVHRSDQIDAISEAEWTGRDWWNENALEVELFNTRLANEQFYMRAKEASALPRRDALEVFYVCVVLGFRGLYRDAFVAATLAEPRGLPPDLESWAKQASMAIRLGQAFLAVLADGLQEAVSHPGAVVLGDDEGAGNQAADQVHGVIAVDRRGGAYVFDRIEGAARGKDGQSGQHALLGRAEQLV